ncbi:unnamed protein product [Durusdinium trenchii]|uniref:CAP-Gly domain-containing protein n=1 Tax=Durusdinium trenchii TaxID=1381693 RepID=A0ABP0J3H0_9DINO
MSSKGSAKARRSASASQGAPVEARAKPQRPSTAESTSSARRVSAPATVIVAEHQLGKRVKVLAAEKWHFGTVRFNGTTSFATGSWIGVELDDAVGKNDGTVQEVTYFTCAAKHGLFCRPTHVHSDEPAVPKPKPAVKETKVVKETKMVVKEADRAQLAECKTITDATRAGLLRAVQRFFHDDPAAVRSADENGRTAHFATLNRGNIVKELLAARAAQVADHDGETPLQKSFNSC